MSITTGFIPNQGTAPGSNVKDWAYEMGVCLCFLVHGRVAAELVTAVG